MQWTLRGTQYLLAGILVLFCFTVFPAVTQDTWLCQVGFIILKKLSGIYYMQIMCEYVC